MLGRREDAEDVVMETVTDAFAEISSLRDPGAFEGWIFRILMNKLRRKRKSYIGESVELNEDITASAQMTSDEGIALRSALDKLPDRDREIIMLDVLGGYRSDEIAQMLGMNANTVRSRKLRAFERIRTMLKED
ncbi:MAG: sigma-70 family RNA polymerase sigma factor [Oscillospiraceae bacterium]|nr:sigma-70 family RNA polymerase sigma factor [Oscillospiraceae bacterium]